MVGSAWGSIGYVAALLIIVTNSDAANARKKDRDVSGLYPFPRVGRQASSDSVANEFIKRQGLIPFPRVGRGGVDALFRSSRQSENDVNSLWFGPRLGRSLKDYPNNEWTLIEFDGPAPKSTTIQDSELLEPSLLIENGAVDGENSRIPTIQIKSLERY